MADEESDNQLPVEEDDQSVLSPKAAEAIFALKEEIERLTNLGEAGLTGLRLLLDSLGDEVFSQAESVIASRQEEHEKVSDALLLFASRNLEFLSRAVREDVELFSSGVRYILREAEELVIVAHAMAATQLIQAGSTEEIRVQGRRAYEVCRHIADERGFTDRMMKSLEGERAS